MSAVKKKETFIHVRISDEAKEIYEKEAEKMGMSFAVWVRYQLNKAAGI